MAKYLYIQGSEGVTLINTEQIATLQYQVGGADDNGMLTLSSGQAFTLDKAGREEVDELLRQQGVIRPAPPKS